MTEFAGKRVVVMGLGRFGGGVGVARWLCARGARVRVTDRAPAEDLAESLADLGGLDIDYRLGQHDPADLGGCDLLVVSPAVDKRQSSFFRAAVSRGIPWTTEMRLFLERCRARIIAITGTAGKSTTTAMTAAILDAAREAPGWRHGRVFVGGNIGRSLLDEVASMGPDDLVVLELSSFQLEDGATRLRSPHLALLTNFRENHLDRHGTLAAYAEAKAQVYRHQARHDWLAMPFGQGVDRLPRGWEDRPRLYRFGVDAKTGRARIRCRNNRDYEPELVAIRLNVPGLHNVHNAAGALSIGRMLGVADVVALPALERFAGLPHRLEFVREYRGVRYYNDSKATSPDAAMTSLAAFDGPIVLLAGGSDKGSSFEALGRAIADRAKGVVCLGATREAIGRAVRRGRGDAGSPIIKTVDDLQEAVVRARGIASPGDAVLLSPACASYDQFRNYEARGEAFKRIVGGWA